jgi:predicted transcriptional regulator of viral defense system
MDRTLSHNESKIVLDLAWRRQETVTLEAIRAALACSESYARFMAHRLVKKGWLDRLRPGLYQLVPAERGREGVADTNPLAAGAVLAAPYFFSFGTACTHHGLTEQVFSEVYLVTRTRRRPRLVRGKRYVFVPAPEERFFGFAKLKVLGAAVRMATTERALVDAVDRPRYAGGIGEVSRIVARASRRVSWDVLLDGLRRFGESALVQRLGYLLELNRVAVPRGPRAALRELVRPGSKILLGPRDSWGLRGPLSSAWNVIENVPREVLLSNDERPKRRVTFGRKGAS